MLKKRLKIRKQKLKKSLSNILRIRMKVVKVNLRTLGVRIIRRIAIIEIIIKRKINVSDKISILLRSEEKIITAHVIISLTAAIIIEIIMIVGIIMNLMKLAVCVNATIQ